MLAGFTLFAHTFDHSHVNDGDYERFFGKCVKYRNRLVTFLMGFSPAKPTKFAGVVNHGIWVASSGREVSLCILPLFILVA